MPASEAVSATGQSFGFAIDHVSLVSGMSLSRSMKGGVAVKRPVMSAMQSGGGGGPSGGIAWEGLASTSVIAMAIDAARQAERRESTPQLTAANNPRPIWLLSYPGRLRRVLSSAGEIAIGFVLLSGVGLKAGAESSVGPGNTKLMTSRA